MSDRKAQSASAGVGLTMFHLGRLGLEFSMTIGNSGFGDLWVRTPTGRVSVEVKSTASHKHTFLISMAQVARVDFYSLVHIQSAACYVAASDEVARHAGKTYTMDGAEVFMLSAASLPPHCLHGWAQIAGDMETAGIPRVVPLKGKPQYRHVLQPRADGTFARYTYDRHRPGRVQQVILTPDQVVQFKRRKVWDDVTFEDPTQIIGHSMCREP